MQAIDSTIEAIDPNVQLVLWAETASLEAVWRYREQLVRWLTQAPDEASLLLVQERIERLDAVLAERGVKAA